nr:hypothetical protein [Tanacetum cinerariifolium]
RQDSLNSVAGGNLLETRTQDVLTIIKNKSKDNIQGYVAAAAVNYNQGNSGYRPSGVANQIRPPGFAQPNVQNNQNRFSQPQEYNRGNNFNQDQSYQALTQQNQVVPLSSGSLPGNTIANPKGELKAITTRSGIVLDGPSVPIPPPFINLEEDERVEETLTDQDLAEDPLHPNIPYPSRIQKQKQQEKDEVQIHKFWQMFKQMHINITLADALILIPKYQKMLKALLSNKEKLLELANTPLNKNCSAVILKKLPEKLRDPRKFLIPCGFIDFVIVDYESDPRFLLILERPFLRTAGALIDVHREEMILCDDDERLTLNMRHDTSSYSNQPQKESINMINIYDDLSEDFLEELFTTNHQSGNPTFPSHPKLTSPEVKDDIFDPKRGNILIEKLLDLDSTKDPCEKLLNINLLIAKIKSLNDNPTPDYMLKPPSPSPIPVEDSDSFLEKSDTSLSYSDNSLPEYETFSNHIKETNSGSTTTHADYSLTKYDLFLFEIEPDHGKLTSVVMKDNLVEPRVHVPKVLTTHPTLIMDSDFIPSDNSLPEYEIFYFDIEEKNSGSTTIHANISLSNLECFNFKLDPGELTSIVDSEIRENVPSAPNVNLPPEKDHFPLFAYVV